MLPFRYALRNLLRDPARLAQTVGGSFLVVLLMIAAAGFNEGMRSLLGASGSPRNMIFLAKGSEESLERSEIKREVEAVVAAGLSGIEAPLSVPAVSPEIQYLAPVATRSSSESQAIMRGVTEKALLVRPMVKLSQGHFPSSGQAMVGRLAYRKLGVPEADLAPGALIRFGKTDFTVSGIFEASGSLHESEIWIDLNDIAAATQRETLSSVVARLSPTGDVEDANVLAMQRNDLELFAIQESEYYAKLARFFSPILLMAWITAALVAASAIFGGLNTLYAAFASRIRELGTLQAIGYTRPAIFLSLLQESLLATLVGGLLALLTGRFLLEGITVPFSIGTFTFALSPAVLATGVITSTALGLLGTIPPALRCLRPSLPSSLSA
jgi:putative ABC transport system permease protein